LESKFERELKESHSRLASRETEIQHLLLKNYHSMKRMNRYYDKNYYTEMANSLSSVIYSLENHLLAYIQNAK
jgi:hypothetical protein